MSEETSSADQTEHVGKMESARIVVRRTNLLSQKSRSAPYVKIRPTAHMEAKFLEAISYNNSDAVKAMIEQGMSPNTCECFYSRSALHIACSRGYVDMVQLLLEHGANPNIQDDSRNTPLHLASCTESIKLVKILLAHGTNVLLKDSSGLLALEIAIGKLRISERIISKMQKLTRSVIHQRRDEVVEVCELIFTAFKRQVQDPTHPNAIDPRELEKLLADVSEQLSKVKGRTIDFDSIVDQIENLHVKSEIDSDVNSLLSTLQKFSL